MHKLEPIIIDPKTFLYQHCSLPALPQIILEIQQIMNSPKINATKIGELISKDPGLVAQILKLVNSAYYGLRREISETKLAVAYLGINEVYRITLALSVIKTLQGKDREDFERIWYHSLLTAFCAKYLAKKFNNILSTDELWTAAILHDVGKLVYLKFYPEYFHLLLEYTRSNGCLFTEAEEHFSFPNSSYLGALLCDRWRLPDIIKQACKSHSLMHLKEMTHGTSTDDFLKIVTLANLFAQLLTDDFSQEKRKEIINDVTVSLKIDDEQFWLVMGDLAESKVEARNLLETSDI